MVRNTGKLLMGLAAFTIATSVFAEPTKETMCVKQKDGPTNAKRAAKV